MKGRPFALLGVNADDSLEALRTIIAENRINWRNWWIDTSRNAIDRDWDVNAWPTTYVIDGDGIIRRCNVFGQELSNVVEALVREVESKQPSN